MTLYGPLTAQNYLRLLKTLARGAPERTFFLEVLDALIETLEAERGFLLRLRADGGFRTFGSRNHEQQTVARPEECISHFVVQRVLDSQDGVHHTDSAHVDRRYRTESRRRGRKQPRSILAFRISEDTGPGAVIYLDHRFQELAYAEHQRTSVEHWLVLVQLALKLRDRDKALARHDTRKERDPATARPEPEPPARPVAPRDFHGLWTCSSRMVELFETVERLASSDIPVVVHGETGTGKGLLAAAIHACSVRREAPFLSVNCGAIPDALLESELFGHIQGSFTGAESNREGLLVEADGGTLFLDEIADMSATMQKKLLRFLENGRFRQLGGKSELQADVRILSATRLVLEEEVEVGRFRSDLYYRLCGVRLMVPSLREHGEDICGLAELFLERFSAELNLACPLLTDAARNWLLRYSWPGNVRELENTMRQLIAVGGPEIGEGDLTSTVWRGRDHMADPAAASSGSTIDDVVAEAERRAIVDALGQSAGNKSRAASLLGITRKSLYRRLVKYGLLE